MTPSPFRTPFGPRLTAFASVFTMVALAACADNPVAPGEQKVDQITAPADAVTTPLADSAATRSDSTVASGLTPRFLAVGYMGYLRDARIITWKQGTTTLTLTARVNFDVTNLGYTGSFHYYTQAVANVAMVKICNTTHITLRAGKGRSTVRPFLNWEYPGHKVHFDHIATTAVSPTVNDYKYRGSVCNGDSKNAGISSFTADPLSWEGGWSVSHIWVTTVADLYYSNGVLARRVVASDNI